MDIVFVQFHCLMRVSAKNIRRIFQFCISDRVGGNFFRNTQPRFAAALHPPRDSLLLGIDLLEKFIESAGDRTDDDVLVEKFIELMSVDRDIALILKFPYIFVEDRDPEQMCQDLRDAVVVAGNPGDFDATLRIGKFSNV